jgi:glycosyltransferase involved in cell wall biosynthesis
MTITATVLMSVYNGLPYLSEAIESVLAQTYRDFEFLIIDDASTDGSDRVLSKYATRDPRIKILTNQRNRGLGYSLARGVEAASGTWIARIDADDIARPDRLQLQMNHVEQHPEVDVLGGHISFINERGDFLFEKPVPISHEEIYRLIWTNPFNHITVLFRRESILKVGSYSDRTRRSEDYELWVRCAAAGLRFANLPVVLTDYRFSEDNLKRNSFPVLLERLAIGWKGCRLVKAPLTAYIGVTVPFIVGVLPSRLGVSFYRWSKNFDPRYKKKSNL